VENGRIVKRNITEEEERLYNETHKKSEPDKVRRSSRPRE
jgi:hypothetical protein